MIHNWSFSVLTLFHTLSAVASVAVVGGGDGVVVVASSH